MKLFKKFIEWDKEMTTKTPKTVRICCFVSILIGIILQVIIGYHLIATVCIFIGLLTHPYIFPRVKELYNNMHDTRKFLNDKESDWMEIK